MNGSSSSSLSSRSVPWLGEGLSRPSPGLPVLRYPLPDRVVPVFVQVVPTSFGWPPLSSVIVLDVYIINVINKGIPG